MASAAVASAGKLVGLARLRRHRKRRPAADPPLYDTRTAHQLLAISAGASRHPPAIWFAKPGRPSRQSHGGSGNFEAWWRQTLEDGVVAEQRAAMVAPPAAKLPEVTARVRAAKASPSSLSRPTRRSGTAAAANNAWLQECPKPFSKQVWGNALHLVASGCAASRPA